MKTVLLLLRLFVLLLASAAAPGFSALANSPTFNSPIAGQATTVPSPSISTGALAKSSFCAGDTISVPFTVTEAFASGNVFVAQLSDSTGSFSSFFNIGSLVGTTSGTITAYIPTADSGHSYRIRVIASSPSVTGTDNGTNITINPLPQIPLYTVSSTSILVGQYTTVSIANDTIPSGATCAWNFGPGATPATSNKFIDSVSYSTPGAKSPVLTVTTAAGCSYVYTPPISWWETINVYSCNPVIPSAAVVETANSAASYGSATIWLCSGVSFTNGGGGSDVYFVETGGSVTNPGGSALVYLKAGASANSDYSGSVIFVKDPLASVTANGGSNVVLTCPSVSFDYANYPCGNGCIGTGLSFLSQPSGQWVCAGSSASFSASAASSGAIYEWQVDTANFGNFTIILNDSTYSGATTSTLTVTKASASMNGYYYRCILRDSACTASLTNTSDSAKLTVNNCISGITSGAQNSDMIQVYPNPAASQLQVTSSTVQVQTMSVTNMLGVKVIDKSSYVSTLDISGLESGIYFLSVTDQSGNMYQNKFIKQ